MGKQCMSILFYFYLLCILVLVYYVNVILFILLYIYRLMCFITVFVFDNCSAARKSERTLAILTLTCSHCKYCLLAWIILSTDV